MSKAKQVNPPEQYVALLRGVNVGGNGKLAMADLRISLEELGFSDVRTILQSGNAIFRGTKQPPAGIEKVIEAALSEQMRVGVDVLVRTAAEWSAIIKRNPFAKESADDPAHVVVMVLKVAPTDQQVLALQAEIRGPEVIRSVGRELYVTYPNGIGRSRLTGTLIEKKLSTRGTARNWNTVLRIAGSLT